MAEEKTYVFGESANNGILGLLGPMLSQRGVDPNYRTFIWRIEIGT